MQLKRLTCLKRRKYELPTLAFVELCGRHQFYNRNSTIIATHDNARKHAPNTIFKAIVTLWHH